MKVVIITFLLVGLLSFVTHWKLKKETGMIEQEVTKVAQHKAREMTRRQQERLRRIVDLRATEESVISPFIERMNRELEQEIDEGPATHLDILQKLRDLSIDEIKFMNQQLLGRYNESQSANLYPLIQASDLILLEADPLFLLRDENLRQTAYQIWASRASTAFQSLLRKDPEAARRYFKEIPLQDLQSGKWPFTKIYREMMGHLFTHDPEAAIRCFRTQKDSSYLPRDGSRRQLSSMDQVMPYAELLRSKPWHDPSVSALVRWASEEAERLGGLEGLARFSKDWAGSEKSEAEQWSFFLSQKSAIRSREGADQLMEFLEKNEQSGTSSHLWQLAQNWSGIDLKGASQWIQEQPAGPARDRLIEGILSGLFWADEAAAEDWIHLIQDDTERAQHLETIDAHEAPYRNQ